MGTMVAEISTSVTEPISPRKVVANRRTAPRWHQIRDQHAEVDAGAAEPAVEPPPRAWSSVVSWASSANARLAETARPSRSVITRQSGPVCISLISASGWCSALAPHVALAGPATSSAGSCATGGPGAVGRGRHQHLARASSSSTRVSSASTVARTPASSKLRFSALRASACTERPVPPGCWPHRHPAGVLPPGWPRGSCRVPESTTSTASRDLEQVPVASRHGGTSSSHAPSPAALRCRRCCGAAAVARRSAP